MRKTHLLTLATILCSAAPVAAAAQELPSERMRAATTAQQSPDEAVRWSGDADQVAGADRLIDLLRFADFEGYNEGPTVAAQAEALRARAAGGDVAAAKQLSQLLDRAYLDYVTILQAPVLGVEYGDPYQKPMRFSRADHVTLLTQARSLSTLVRQNTAMNVVYEQLRASAKAYGRGLPVESAHALKATMARVRALPKRNRFVLVDVASQRLWMYDNGQPVDSMKVVVGKNEMVGPVDSRTPLIVSTIHYATHNPYWHVPDNLVRKTVGPNIKRMGESYMRPRGYEIVDRWALDANVVDPKTVDWSTALRPGNLKVRQRPGPTNSMGDFKFNFPNATGIYLHDTPMREYFGRDMRALSNGCIRLEDAERFAGWLYKGQGVPDIGGTEYHHQLPEGVAVFVTYLTAEAIDGALAFSHDVYGLDGEPQLVEQVAEATATALADEAASF
ncbi:L,D-transpeptidase family protein [Sphingomicrobium arenosum]|uniref:L,D-transpeptidase family protein n=1 Tax=Sphingomicrobium arenosum TaxID=2233861 RepID=UPI00223EF2A8|nr:L,D-transpeptidase family protein [Sphingomicrobium arenosum]